MFMLKADDLLLYRITQFRLACFITLQLGDVISDLEQQFVGFRVEFGAFLEGTMKGFELLVEKVFVHKLLVLLEMSMVC